SGRYDETVSCVILIKGEQFGVAALPLAGFKIPRQILQSCFSRESTTTARRLGGCGSNTLNDVAELRKDLTWTEPTSIGRQVAAPTQHRQKPPRGSAVRSSGAAYRVTPWMVWSAPSRSCRRQIPQAAWPALSCWHWH